MLQYFKRGRNVFLKSHIFALVAGAFYKRSNILTCSGKLHGFRQKLQLWQNELGPGTLEMFSRSYKNQKNVEKGFVLNLAKEHLH